MQIKAVCFDLHGTLVYVAKPISEKSASDLLVSRGYEVYPQALDAAWQICVLRRLSQVRLQELE
jgi:phosphoglycolate phosphatase-like HAD superfamily hydrolase